MAVAQNLENLMQSNGIQTLLNNPKTSETSSVIDTSFLFEELRRTFAKSGEPVDVDFRKMVDWLRLGDQLTHQLHPYPAKLLPHIAHFFLRCRPSSHSGLVLDPFCGSGTVALEASMADCIPLVADANPFALLLTKVKTTAFNSQQLREATAKIVERAKRLRTAPVVQVVNDEKWYAKEVKVRLEILLRSIREFDDPDLQDFFLICFSMTARKVSRIDPAISVPVQLRAKESFSAAHKARIAEQLSWIENARPIDEFFRICHANIDRVEVTNRLNPKRLTAIVVGNDARHVSDNEIVKEGVPLVISSPPYGTAQKYVRASSLALNWLGLAEPAGLSSLEWKSIGREHSPAYRNENAKDLLPSQFEDLLFSAGKINPLREKITRQYLLELKASLIEMQRATSGGGRVVIVIGNNQVCGMTLRTDEFISQTMQSMGLKLELSLVDQIKSRGLLTKRNSTASVIAREHILVFSKPL